MHSDQGWQYQHDSYQQRLKNKGISQSMSRKGNSMDNGMMENFFGILKTEMFYDQEENYKTLDDLKTNESENIKEIEALENKYEQRKNCAVYFIGRFFKNGARN